MSVCLHQERKENQIKSRKEKVFRPRDFFCKHLIFNKLRFFKEVNLYNIEAKKRPLIEVFFYLNFSGLIIIPEPTMFAPFRI